MPKNWCLSNTGALTVIQSIKYYSFIIDSATCIFFHIHVLQHLTFYGVGLEISTCFLPVQLTRGHMVNVYLSGVVSLPCCLSIFHCVSIAVILTDSRRVNVSKILGVFHVLRTLNHKDYNLSKMKLGADFLSKYDRKVWIITNSMNLHFFWTTLTKIYCIKIIHLWTQISYSTPY